MNKVRIEKAFGKGYSKDEINKRLYLSRQIVFKPIPQKSIFKEDLNNFSKINYDEYKNLMDKIENLWKQYHKVKVEEDIQKEYKTF